MNYGRYAYGVGAIVFGALMLHWHDVKTWQQFAVLGNASYGESLVYAAAVAALVGGIAILLRRSAQLGAVVLGVLYLCFAALYVPHIVAGPRVYDHWGNFFEQFSLFSGALIAYATVASNGSARTARVATTGRIFFGICVISFALEQVFYMQATAGFVPKWIPPGQMFWAIATTIFFVLAAIAILSGIKALLASRLLTAMLLLFGVVIWLPTLFADFHSAFNWSENAENLAIAGVAWMLAYYLRGTGQARVLR